MVTARAEGAVSMVLPTQGVRYKGLVAHICFFFFFGTSQRFWHVVAKTMQKPRVARCGGAAFHLARFIVADGHAESSAPDLF